jgi:catechol 2,3-dioxygenase-like lactoylglutathione lyase family enzyme
MLSAARIGACIPVSDIDRAIEFYGQTLGLGEPERDDIPENPGARFDIGGGELYVYKSVGAGQSRHTLCAFEVENIESEVDDLRGRGVTIEEYDMPGMKTENGIIDMGGGVKGAFFKDPDGNIIGLGQRTRVGAGV